MPWLLYVHFRNRFYLQGRTVLRQGSTVCSRTGTVFDDWGALFLWRRGKQLNASLDNARLECHQERHRPWLPQAGHVSSETYPFGVARTQVKTKMDVERGNDPLMEPNRLLLTTLNLRQSATGQNYMHSLH